jgi:hypothetical protein
MVMDAGSGAVVNFKATELSRSEVTEKADGLSVRVSVTVNALDGVEKPFGPAETVCSLGDCDRVSSSVVTPVPALNAALALALQLPGEQLLEPMVVRVAVVAVLPAGR